MTPELGTVLEVHGSQNRSFRVKLEWFGTFHPGNRNEPFPSSFSNTFKGFQYFDRLLPEPLNIGSEGLGFGFKD